MTTDSDKQFEINTEDFQWFEKKLYVNDPSKATVGKLAHSLIDVAFQDAQTRNQEHPSGLIITFKPTDTYDRFVEGVSAPWKMEIQYAIPRKKEIATL